LSSSNQSFRIKQPTRYINYPTFILS